jgi:hypothetical protein
LRLALCVAPLNGARGASEIGLRTLRTGTVRFAGIANIGENIARVIQDDVEDYVDAELVCGIHQSAKLIVGVVGIASETRIDVQEIVNAVPAIRCSLERNIFKHWTEPESACAELLDVGKLILDASQIATLKIIVIRVIEWLVARRRERIVKPIDHEEVNPLIAPVGRRGKGLEWATGIPVAIENRQEFGCIKRGGHRTSFN